MYNKSGRVNLVVGDRHGEMEELDNLNKVVGIDGEDVVIKLKIPENIELKDGKNMCHNCRSDIKYYAKEDGANSVTVFSLTQWWNPELLTSKYPALAVQ